MENFMLKLFTVSVVVGVFMPDIVHATNADLANSINNSPFTAAGWTMTAGAVTNIVAYPACAGAFNFGVSGCGSANAGYISAPLEAPPGVTCAGSVTIQQCFNAYEFSPTPLPNYVPCLDLVGDTTNPTTFDVRVYVTDTPPSAVQPVPASGVAGVAEGPEGPTTSVSGEVIVPFTFTNGQYLTITEDNWGVARVTNLQFEACTPAPTASPTTSPTISPTTSPTISPTTSPTTSPTECSSPGKKGSSLCSTPGKASSVKVSSPKKGPKGDMSVAALTSMSSTSTTAVPAAVGATVIVVVAVAMLLVQRKRQARMDNERVRTIDSPLDFSESAVNDNESA